MRLFTHNFLQCHVKNCTQNNYPLLIQDAEVEIKETEFNPEFLAMQMCKIDYPALIKSLKQVISSFCLFFYYNHFSLSWVLILKNLNYQKNNRKLLILINF